MPPEFKLIILHTRVTSFFFHLETAYKIESEVSVQFMDNEIKYSVHKQRLCEYHI